MDCHLRGFILSTIMRAELVYMINRGYYILLIHIEFPEEFMRDQFLDYSPDEYFDYKHFTLELEFTGIYKRFSFKQLVRYWLSITNPEYLLVYNSNYISIENGWRHKVVLEYNDIPLDLVAEIVEKRDILHDEFNLGLLIIQYRDWKNEKTA